MTHFSFSGRSLLVAALLLLLLITGRFAARAQNVGIGTTTPGSLLTVNGSFAGGYNAITATTYTLLDNDYYVTWNGTAAGTFTLPAAAAAKKGRIYKIRNNTTTFALSLTTGSALTIDGAATLSLAAGGTIQLIANGNTSGTAWEVVTLGTPASTGTASGTLGGGGGACSPAPTLAGAALTATVPVAGQSLTVTVTVNAPGTYTLGTNTVNGMNYAGSGYFSATGVQTVALYAAGTPAASGTFAYTVAYGSSLCTTNVTVAPAATFACGSATTTYSGGAFVNGTSYSGSYQVSYTAGNGLAYPVTVQTTSGLSFTRPAGTYAAGGGTVTYTLSGTYTGTSGVGITFNVPECTTVSFGADALRSALASAGCASCAAYDAATVNGWVSVTAAEFTAVSNNVSGIGTYGATAAQMATASTGNWGNSVSFTSHQATATRVPDANFIVGLVVRSSLFAPASMAGMKLKTSNSSASSGFTDYSGAGIQTPNAAGAMAASTLYYFIMKRTISAISGNSWTAMYTPNSYQVGNISGSNAAYFGPGDLSTFSSLSTSVALFQVLGTLTKTW